jgi:hypothetical protein
MFYGLGTPAVDDPGQELAMLLNTMVMVYGGNNILLSIPDLDVHQTQGCIVMAANVPLAVEALVIIVAAPLVGLISLLVIYSIRLWTKDKVFQEEISHVPDTVVAWAAFAAKEHRISKQRNFSQQVRQRGLKDWVVELESVNGERKLRIMPGDVIPDERPCKTIGHSEDFWHKDSRYRLNATCNQRSMVYIYMQYIATLIFQLITLFEVFSSLSGNLLHSSLPSYNFLHGSQNRGPAFEFCEGNVLTNTICDEIYHVVRIHVLHLMLKLYHVPSLQITGLSPWQQKDLRHHLQHRT